MEQSQVTNQRTKKYVDFIVTCIEKHLNNCTIYLFGSRANNSDREGSDVDIALDCGSKIDTKIIARINDELVMSKLPIFVDIVDIHEANAVLKEQIKKHGIAWKK